MGKYDGVEYEGIPAKDRTPIQQAAYYNQKAKDAYNRKIGKLAPRSNKTPEQHREQRRIADRAPHRRAYYRELQKTPKHKAKSNAWGKRNNKTRLDYLRQFNNRFKRMKEKDPTMKDMDDIALRYLAEELMNPETPKARKDQIAFKLLPFTSRAKPQEVSVSGELTHTNLISTEANRKLEQLLFESPAVVATQPKLEDVADGEISDE